MVFTPEQKIKIIQFWSEAKSYITVHHLFCHEFELLSRDASSIKLIMIFLQHLDSTGTVHAAQHESSSAVPDCKVWHFRRDLVGAGTDLAGADLVRILRKWCGFGAVRCGFGAVRCGFGAVRCGNGASRPAVRISAARNRTRDTNDKRYVPIVVESH